MRCVVHALNWMMHDAMKYRNAAENVVEILRWFANELVVLITTLQYYLHVEMRSLWGNEDVAQNCGACATLQSASNEHSCSMCTGTPCTKITTK